MGGLQWPGHVKCSPAATRLPGKRVRIPLKSWIVFVLRVVGSGLCDKLITRSEDFYRVYVSVCLCMCMCVCL